MGRGVGILSFGRAAGALDDGARKRSSWTAHHPWLIALCFIYVFAAQRRRRGHPDFHCPRIHDRFVCWRSRCSVCPPIVDRSWSWWPRYLCARVTTQNRAGCHCARIRYVSLSLCSGYSSLLVPWPHGTLSTFSYVLVNTRHASACLPSLFYCLCELYLLRFHCLCGSPSPQASPSSNGLWKLQLMQPRRIYARLLPTQSCRCV